MKEERSSEIHLRPRFRIEYKDKTQEQLLENFRNNLKDDNCKYCSKIVDGHIIIDVPREDDHFWSPQLNIEVEKIDGENTVVRGLFGPKPQVWTLFMFIHFGVAVAFIGFLILWYVRWSLEESTTFPMIMAIGLPIFWLILYFLGRMGKKTGHQQMDELHAFMMKILEKK